MQRVEVVVDGQPFETWVADEREAAELRIRILEAAEAGSTIRIELTRAEGQELVGEGTLVLRMGSSVAVAVRVRPDDRSGAAMGISR